jgi:DNA protecting protein DprA
LTSNSALRLCELLVSWPRHVINSWLCTKDAPNQVLASPEHPPATLRRRNNVDGFVANHGRDMTQTICILDHAFRPLLKMIPDPPLVLFYLGDANVLAQQSIAIVGTRKCTTVGKLVAEKLAADLAERGVCTVSGLAYGIDAAAHRGSLSRTRGYTAAFLGAGLGNTHPRQNKYLEDKIVAQGGALFSEYPHQTQPRPYHFPERNRLISGSTWATVMVEVGEQCSSLITARMALEQGREVFAVPGLPLSEVSKGCHRMIRQGAALVANASGVVEEMGWVTLAKENTANISAPVIIDIISDTKQKKSQNVKLAKAGLTEGNDNDSKTMSRQFSHSSNQNRNNSSAQ